MLISSASVPELALHPVDHRVRAEQEQCRGARRDLLPDVVDERVADADVGHRAEQSAGGGADGQAEDRDEEDQAEQQAPETAAERPCLLGVVQLTGLGLLASYLPADHRGVLDVDQLLALQLLQLLQRDIGALGGRELPCGKSRHVVSACRSPGGAGAGELNCQHHRSRPPPPASPGTNELASRQPVNPPAPLSRGERKVEYRSASRSAAAAAASASATAASAWATACR